MSEADLVRRTRQGDSAAWESLVVTHQVAMFRLAYLLVDDADEAEDVTQEAFMRAYRALERFDLERPLLPWLMSICANLARNRRRSAGRRLNALRRLISKQPAPPTSVEDRTSQRWQAHTLRQAVQRLSDSDQQVIYLRYFLDMSVEETASTLNLPGGTVKSRLHRALERLQSVIEQEFPGLKDTFDG